MAHAVENLFLEKIESLLRSSGTLMSPQRQKAFEKAKALGFPSSKEEKWRYTNVQFLKQKPVSDLGWTVGAFSDLDRQVHFLNGSVSHGFMAPFALYDVSTGGLRPVEETDSEDGHNFFSLLNQALFSFGFEAWITESSSSVFHLVNKVNVSQEEGLGFYNMRNKIRLSKGVTFSFDLDQHVEGDNFLNVHTEIHLDENATLYFLKREKLGPASLFLERFSVHLAKGAKCYFLSATEGGRLLRNEGLFYLMGDGATTKVHGVYSVSEKQLIDHQTEIYHQTQQTKSEQLYKGILRGRSRGVFNGKIKIEKGAMRSSAAQLNKSLLLDSLSEMNARPHLEIETDDVKATHGATMGQIDEEALFYLMSRGISRKHSEELLLKSFIKEPIEHSGIPWATQVLSQKGALYVS